ncbi:MAG: PAS domain S-box protein, partial [Caulobacteraceae bacterium]
MGEASKPTPVSLDGAVGWFFENSLDIFITLDGPLVASVNPAFVKLTGYAADEAIGRSVFDFLPADERDVLEADVYDQIRAAGVFEGRHGVETRHGRKLYIRSQVRAGRRGEVHAIWQDITADHIREQEREEARRDADMLREAAGIRTWRFNPDSNSYLVELDQALSDEGQIRPASLVQGRIVKEDSLAMKAAWDNSLATGAAHSVEYRLHGEDGGIVRARATWRGARQTPSGLWEVQGVTQDVTELAEARDAALSGERAAHQAAEAKAQFLANMSHEIRTPLNGVLGVLHLLKNERLSAEGRKLLDEALACGGMLGELLNDVMDFSKIEAGKLELNPEPIDLAAALEGVTGLLRPQAEAKSLYLRAKIVADANWADIDP